MFKKNTKFKLKMKPNLFATFSSMPSQSYVHTNNKHFLFRGSLSDSHIRFYSNLKTVI